MLLVGLAAAGPSAAQGLPPSLGESKLKAEFIDRFARFTEWPSSAPDGSAQPFVIGVLGRTPVAPQLEELARRRRILERPVEVRRLTQIDEMQRCHVVWISGEWRERLTEVVEQAKEREILTVADTEGFGERGVMLNIARSGRMLSFEINVEAVRNSRLRLSSQLFRLGRPVGGRRASGR